jgi:hypothetical protein
MRKLTRTYGNDRVLAGQISLFGGVCPQCGLVPVRIRFPRGVRETSCAHCGAQVNEDLSCGCAGVGR